MTPGSDGKETAGPIGSKTARFSSSTIFIAGIVVFVIGIIVLQNMRSDIVGTIVWFGGTMIMLYALMRACKL